MRRPEIRARNPLLAPSMRDANLGLRDAFRAGLCATEAVALRLQAERDELGWRAERLWRKHRGRKIETEKMLGRILLGDSNAGACQEHGAKSGGQDFSGPYARNPQGRLI